MAVWRELRLFGCTRVLQPWKNRSANRSPWREENGNINPKFRVVSPSGWTPPTLPTQNRANITPVCSGPFRDSSRRSRILRYMS
ncbi:hypothetical protein RRG08_014222 [Elysia crispata]|uniref:Uncharacterized protein n=1 Tax=Elysia crispata TaxID=231223 RepID=A0AAE0XEH1_9GAST|nr:hypothetical protein RRG08_014222 [Elysia crispata]